MQKGCQNVRQDQTALYTALSSTSCSTPDQHARQRIRQHIRWSNNGSRVQGAGGKHVARFLVLTIVFRDLPHVRLCLSATHFDIAIWRSRDNRSCLCGYLSSASSLRQSDIASSGCSGLRTPERGEWFRSATKATRKQLDRYSLKRQTGQSWFWI
jgi:hypothetical protein